MRPKRAFVEPAPTVALTAPTPAQISAVTDVLEHRWSSNALLIQDRLTQAVERDDATSAQRWAVAGGISTEKVLLLKGRPTEIMGHLHAHRHELGPMVGKLANALGMGASVQPQVGTRAIGNDAHTPRIIDEHGMVNTPVPDVDSGIQK